MKTQNAPDGHASYYPLTTVQKSVGRDLPTPFIGIWERINIGAFLLWIIVLALTLIGRESVDSSPLT